jgi:hypothetical protein
LNGITPLAPRALLPAVPRAAPGRPKPRATFKSDEKRATLV